MAHQIQPFVKTTTFSDEIKYITVSVSSIILGIQATVETLFQNEQRTVYSTKDVLSGDDYKNWGSDDEYIINWVCKKYGLVLDKTS
jgi:hypothetical protein